MVEQNCAGRAKGKTRRSAEADLGRPDLAGREGTARHLRSPAKAGAQGCKRSARNSGPRLRRRNGQRGTAVAVDVGRHAHSRHPLAPPGPAPRRSARARRRLPRRAGDPRLCARRRDARRSRDGRRVALVAASQPRRARREPAREGLAADPAARQGRRGAGQAGRGDRRGARPCDPPLRAMVGARPRRRWPRRSSSCLHDGNQLAPPGSITTGAGKPFKIYTPFWRALSRHMPPDAPLQRAARHPGAVEMAEERDARRLGPAADQARLGEGLRRTGRRARRARTTRSTRSATSAARYEQTRNLPSEEGTSRLSPHLHFGEVSPRQVWHRVADAGGSVRTFLGELGVARLCAEHHRAISRRRPQEHARRSSTRCHGAPARRRTPICAPGSRGRTGYPIVDAGHAPALGDAAGCTTACG